VTPQNPWLRRIALACPLAVLLLALASGPAWAASGLNPLLPNAVSDNGHDLYNLYLLISPFAILIFVLVEGLLIAIIVKFRRKKLPASYVPPQWRSNMRLEITWTLVPFLILCVIGVASFITLQHDFVEPAAASNNLTISVSGHRYGWVFTYPQGFTVKSEGITATPVVIPVDELVRLQLQSTDVIHGFWVPDLTGKTDLVPGYTNYTWIKVHQTGEWRGQCTELCGPGHYSMQLRVKAVSQSDFDAWVAQQTAGPQQTTSSQSTPSASPSVSASPSPSPGASASPSTSPSAPTGLLPAPGSSPTPSPSS
jgi:cytochrome c oxidase subunit 2